MCGRALADKVQRRVASCKTQSFARLEVGPPYVMQNSKALAARSCAAPRRKPRMQNPLNPKDYEVLPRERTNSKAILNFDGGTIVPTPKTPVDGQ
jgi:hypothetical protein